MVQRNWETNADEFRDLDAGEGWPFAVLVVCSVEKLTQGGDRRSNRDRDLKTNASAFARRAGTSADRVIRYLDGWDRAVAKYGCTPAAALGPNDVLETWVPDQPWTTVYDARKAGGRPRDSKPQDAATIIERRGADAVVEALSPAQRKAVVQSAIRNDHGAAEAATNALVERNTAGLPARAQSVIGGVEKRQQEFTEAQKRSVGHGVNLWVQIRMLIDEAAKYEHWQVIDAIPEYIKLIAGMDDAEIAAKPIGKLADLDPYASKK